MRKQRPDQSTLDTFRKEAERLQKIELGIQTDSGKEILAVIREGYQKALNDLVMKDISGFNDALLIAFPYSIRGKLQAYTDLLRYFEHSGEEKQKIQQELAQYDNNSEKGE